MTPAAASGSCRRPRSPCHRLGGPSPAPPPGSPAVLAGEVRSQGGGEGRDQAQGPSRQGPQGQGNGPEGERDHQRYRSPDPGRRRPCGCPPRLVLLELPHRGPIRLPPGGSHHYAPRGPPVSTVRRDSGDAREGRPVPHVGLPAKFAGLWRARGGCWRGCARQPAGAGVTPGGACHQPAGSPPRLGCTGSAGPGRAGSARRSSSLWPSSQAYEGRVC